MLDIVICAQKYKLLQYNVLKDPIIIKTYSKDNNIVNNKFSREMVTYYRI